MLINRAELLNGQFSQTKACFDILAPKQDKQTHIESQQITQKKRVKGELIHKKLNGFFQFVNGYIPGHDEETSKHNYFCLRDITKAIWPLYLPLQVIGLVSDRAAKLARAWYGACWSIVYSCYRPWKDNREQLAEKDSNGNQVVIKDWVKKLFNLNEHFRFSMGSLVSAIYGGGGFAMLWGALTGNDDLYDKASEVYTVGMFDQNMVFASMNATEVIKRNCNIDQCDEVHKSKTNIKAKIELTDTILFPFTFITRTLDTFRMLGMNLSEGLSRYTRALGFAGYGTWAVRFAFLKKSEEKGGDLEKLNPNLSRAEQKIDQITHGAQEYGGWIFCIVLPAISWLAAGAELLGLRELAEKIFKLEGIMERLNPAIAAWCTRDSLLTKLFSKEEEAKPKATEQPVVEQEAQQVQAEVKIPTKTTLVVKETEIHEEHITRTASKTKRHVHVMHLKNYSFRPDNFFNFVNKVHEEIGTDSEVSYQNIPCGSRCPTIILEKLRQGADVIVDVNATPHFVKIASELTTDEINRLHLCDSGRRTNLYLELLGTNGTQPEESYDSMKAWKNVLQEANDGKISRDQIIEICKKGQVTYNMVRDCSDLFQDGNIYELAFDEAYLAELNAQAPRKIPERKQTAPPMGLSIAVTNNEPTQFDSQLSKKDEEPVIIPFNKQIHRSMISLRKGEQNGDISEVTFDHLLVAARKGWINWAHFIKIATQERFWDDFINAVEAGQIPCNVIQDNEDTFLDKNKFYEAEDTALMIEAGQYSAKRGKTYKVQLAAV